MISDSVMQPITTHKITAARQFDFLHMQIFFAVLAITLHVLLFGLGNSKVSETILLLWYAATFTLFILPGLVLHISYLKTNWKARLIIEKMNNSFVYHKGNNIHKSSISDIAAITKISSYFLENSKYSFAPYFYYQVKFKNGGAVIITCLLCDELEILLGMPEHVTFSNKKIVYPLV